MVIFFPYFLYLNNPLKLFNELNYTKKTFNPTTKQSGINSYYFNSKPKKALTSEPKEET